MTTKDSQTLDGDKKKNVASSNIVWLASYPRSGNTMSRHVLYDCLGLRSISEDNFPPLSQSSSSLEIDFVENIPSGMTWPEYVAMAEAGNQLHIVKTHQPPQDDRRAIYIMRDGRKASWSYRCFLRDIMKEDRSLYEILLGADFYGNWSDHVQLWLDRPKGSTIYIKYEEMAGITEDRLKELAEFLSLDNGQIKPWVNTFKELQQFNPSFYREGKKEWEAPEEWTDGMDEIFRALHGPMMEKTGYWQEGASSTNLSSEMLVMLRLAASEATLNRGYAKLRILQQYERRVLDLKEKRENDAVKIANLKTQVASLKIKKRPWYKQIMKES